MSRMMKFALWLSACTILLEQTAMADGEYGSCSSHPAYFQGLNPVLVKHWIYMRTGPRRANYFRSYYLPRYADYVYSPIDKQNSTMYKGLDLFGTLLPNVYSGKALTMYFNRPARVYMLVSTYYDRHRPRKLSLPGFRSEGWAALDRSKSSDSIVYVSYGIFKRTKEALSNWVYVFSKDAPSSYVELPDLRWIKQQGNLETTKYIVLVAEKDGSASSAPASPAGVGPIVPGSRCPPQLHSKWTTPGTDEKDQDTYQKQFSTWHPIWDPCYWCGYDHEHGSNAGALLGVKPTYNYAAWKNYHQDEYHNGFKTIVFRKQRYLVSYDFHIEMSQASRFFQRFHSGALTIVDEMSKNVVVSLILKLDYGAAKVRLRNGRRVNIRKEDNAIDREIEGLTLRSRLVNIIFSSEKSKLDPQFQYRTGNDYMLGTYEQWRTVFPCSTENRAGTFLKVDIQDPGTALKTVTSGPNDPMTILGVLQKDGSVEPHRSLKRKLDIGGMTLSYDLCPPEVKNAAANGEWYTDTKGHEVFTEPAKDRMRQYIKPGFSLTLDGSYFVGDNRFTGLYEDGISGEFTDIQNTIDPYNN